jgi:hypothetical protein
MIVYIEGECGRGQIEGECGRGQNDTPRKLLLGVSVEPIGLSNQ